MKFEIIRDPLWNNIRVDAFTMRLVDTPAFQRLRYVRQLGLAYLVYPGATHSRETWSDGAVYDEQARKLAGRFRENIEKFDGVTEEIRKAGPR